MKDPDRSVRRRASLLALGLEGEGARRLGEEAIHDPDPEVRSLAALALGRRQRGERPDDAAGGAQGRRGARAPGRPRRASRASSAMTSPRWWTWTRAGAAGRSAGSPRSPCCRCAPRSCPKPSPRAARCRSPVASTPVVPAAVQAPVPAPAVRPGPAPSTAHRAAVPAAAAPGPGRGAAGRPGRRRIPRAGPARVALQRAPASPVEALCGPLMAEIRAAIRGRSLGELAAGMSASLRAGRGGTYPPGGPGSRHTAGSQILRRLRQGMRPRRFRRRVLHGCADVQLQAGGRDARRATEVHRLGAEAGQLHRRRRVGAARPARRVPAAARPPQAALPQLQGRHRARRRLSTSYAWRLAELGYARAAHRPRQPGPRHQVPGLRGRGLRQDAARRPGAQVAHVRGHPEVRRCPTWTSSPPT